MRGKKEKLVLPNGNEITIRFLSRSKNGVVIGTIKLEGIEPSHLTVIKKRGKIQAHITPRLAM